MECDRRENSAFARGPHRQVSSSGVTVPGPGFTPAWKDVLGKRQTPGQGVPAVLLVTYMHRELTAPPGKHRKLIR